MSKPGPKFSGLVAAGIVQVPAGVKPSTNFERGEDVPADGLIDGHEYMIRMDLLDDSPYQTRLTIDPARVDEVGDQLEDQGQIDAVEFRRSRTPGRLELIKGHTRKYGALSKGWVELRGVYKDLTDAQADIACMLDNTGAAPTEYEYAGAFQHSLDTGYAKTQSAVGKMFGFSQATVSKGLAMLQLPAPVRALLDAQPALFGAKTAAVVANLWSDYPEHSEVILQGIRRFNDGLEQGQLHKWVMEQIADIKRKAAKAAQPSTEKKKGSAQQQARRAVINSPTGNECYVTILRDKAMVIEFKDLAIPAAKAQEAVNNALIELAKSHKSSGHK
jgi:ParB/RepB/Spo0J family partition protein